jgi:hypothetical protein
LPLETVPDAERPLEVDVGDGVDVLVDVDALV